MARFSFDLVEEEEISWLLARHPLVFDLAQFRLDYGESLSQLIVKSFIEAREERLLPLLNVPGVATRWRHFLSWSPTQLVHEDLHQILRNYANALGKVTSYRCLALKPADYERIVQSNSVWPTSRLRASEETVSALLRAEGVAKVAVARLYIGLRLVKLDPSLSLHDDLETALCIAQGYYTEGESKVYVFPMRFPLIACLGWSVADVHTLSDLFVRGKVEKGRWFLFNNIWFDANLHRTERYVLHEIPFLRERLAAPVFTFDADSAIAATLQPFRLQQDGLHAAADIVAGAAAEATDGMDVLPGGALSGGKASTQDQDDAARRLQEHVAAAQLRSTAA